MSCPVILTAGGRVNGIETKVLNSRIVFSYRNLPYGKPPVGNRRFMPPEPALPWDGVLDCTMQTNIPMQLPKATREMQRYAPTLCDLSDMEDRMSEDCLRLSLYTSENYSDGKRPVMVWLYGGAYQMGFADMIDGSVLSALHDVVIVVPNYRVGVFGFFSTGPETPCKGNAGLLDQQLALRWVQENIAAFGGDKNNVTIFGESAGGVSVNHHVNSPMSRGLFHKAISHSGQSTLSKLFKVDLTKARETFLDILHVEEKDATKRLEILQKMPASTLANADLEMQMRLMAFDPTIDGIFIEKHPLDSLKQAPTNKVPYMIGCNDSEGHGMLTLLAHIPKFETGMDEDMTKVLITNFIPRMGPTDLEECQDACMRLYVKNSEDEFRYSKAYGDIYTDSLFVAPAVTTAKSHTKFGCPVYFYYGRFQIRFNHDPEFGPEVAQKPEWCFCDHSDDIYFMWGAPLVPDGLSGGAKFTDEEKELSRKCMKYITNFAKTGNPNVGEPVDLHWPPFSTNGKYIELGDNMKIEENLLPENVKFWSETIIEKIKKRDKAKL